jgi:hypothetical protein
MKIFEKQGYHLLSLLFLVGGVWFAAGGELLRGSWLGISSGTWLVLAVLFPILHQVYVLLGWRGEYYYGWLSGAFGDQAFSVWAFGFMVLFLARPFTVLGLAVANRGTLPLPLWATLPLITVCLGLVAYLAYSFLKYFGAERALGRDHFQPDLYRDLPLVKEGIFRWSSNAMYTYGFLALWAIGLIFTSRAALLAALFNHLYIWVHYYTTELPDMRHIYRGT